LSERVFTEVSVAGGPLVQFCVDPAAGDPVASWFLDHGSIDEPVQRAFSGLVEPGMHVLDLGCHLGTFSLAAAALGASVLAVDAAASHVELLNAAAARNGFSQLHAIQRAISDSQTPIAFVERSIHGHVLLADDLDRSHSIEVETATVDALLDERGWDDVDLIKMDIEGMEMAALTGMRRLFGRGCRPAIVFECNGSMLPRSGSSICALRRRLVELAYELLMIDHLHPGTLVQAEADAIQPECVCDYVAVPVGTGSALARDWRVEPPFTRAQTISRLIDTAAIEGAGYRAYAAELLACGPEGLRSEPGVGAVLRALALDRDGAVRAALRARPGGSTASEHALADAPPSGGPPADMRVWARGISVGTASGELDRAVASTRTGEDDEPPNAELLLRDASFHVRRGQLVGVICSKLDCADALLRVLANLERPHGGELFRDGRPVLLARVADGLEGGLTVEENIALFGAFLGCSVAEARAAAPRIAEVAGLQGRLGGALDELDAAAVAALTLVVALELGGAQLLLVDQMPTIAPGPSRDWLTGRIWGFRSAGGSVVQVISQASDLLAPADRLIWIEDGSIVASGHPDAVLNASWLSRLGLHHAGAGATR
jgi:FkbM family methyltransferase